MACTAGKGFSRLTLALGPLLKGKGREGREGEGALGGVFVSHPRALGRVSYCAPCLNEFCFSRIKKKRARGFKMTPNEEERMSW